MTVANIEDVEKTLEIAIECMEELEQYRELGTPKEIKIREVSSAQLRKAYLSNLTELREYQSLGTVEELKEAREKQVAKKPIIEDDFCLQSGINRCPNCGKFMHDRQQYCEICGQRIDVKSVNIPRGINK